MRKLDIKKGDKYNRLTIICEIEPYKWNNINMRQVKCICDCGNQWEGLLNHIRNGNTKSCGCQNDDKRKLPKLIKHGHKSINNRTSEYNAWDSMKQRCLNVNNCSYKHYGGRGIKVCDRWLESFNNFLEDMGIKPSIEYSIDRINVNGNYEPSNCRWSTPKQQANNRRNNARYTTH